MKVNGAKLMRKLNGKNEDKRTQEHSLSFGTTSPQLAEEASYLVRRPPFPGKPGLGIRQEREARERPGSALPPGHLGAL